ncbi:unnamed protein product [Cutaneotrichosporon oleaginosum]
MLSTPVTPLILLFILMVGKSKHVESTLVGDDTVTTTTTRSTNLRGVTTEKEKVTVNGKLESSTTVVTQKNGSAVETTKQGDGRTTTVTYPPTAVIREYQASAPMAVPAASYAVHTDEGPEQP